jgi:hypothetical protein
MACYRDNFTFFTYSASTVLSETNSMELSSYALLKGPPAVQALENLPAFYGTFIGTVLAIIFW